MAISGDLFEEKKDISAREDHTGADISDVTPSFRCHYFQKWSYNDNSADGDGSLTLSSHHYRQRMLIRVSTLLIVKSFLIVSLTLLSFIPSLAIDPVSQPLGASSGFFKTGSVASGKVASISLNSTETLTETKKAEAAHTLALLLLLLGDDEDGDDEINTERPVQISSSVSTSTSSTTSETLLKSQSVYEGNRNHDKDENHHSFLVICTVDGEIKVLNANDGALVCAFNSGSPLVGPSEPIHDNDDEDEYARKYDHQGHYQERRIVPGLDGQLYMTSADGYLKPLEITVLDVLNNPVKTCRSSNRSSIGSKRKTGGCDGGKNNCLDYADDFTGCGIVTATKSTTLFALDPTTGNLVWYQHPNGTTLQTDYDNIDADNEGEKVASRKKGKSASTTVLLQREDVLVQQISTDTGAIVWNVTLGTIQALAFGDIENQGMGSQSPGGQTSNDQLQFPAEQGLLPAGEETIDGNSNRQEQFEFDNDDDNPMYSMNLPKVIFSENGRSLTAINPSYKSDINSSRTEEHHVMWSREFPSTVASVFGLNGQAWEPLIVLDEYEDKTVAPALKNVHVPRLPKPDDVDNDGNPLLQESDSKELALFQQYQEAIQSPRTDPLNHGRDWLFQNTIGQHRRRHEAPQLFPYFSSSKAGYLLLGGMDLDHDVANSQRQFLQADLEKQSPSSVFCLFSDSNMCLSIDTNGLFLRWPILLLAFVCIATGAIVGYRYFYVENQKNRILDKKKQRERWSELTPASLHSHFSRTKVSFQDVNDINHIAYSADNVDLFIHHQSSCDNQKGQNSKKDIEKPKFGPRHWRLPRADYADSQMDSVNNNRNDNLDLMNNNKKIPISMKFNYVNTRVTRSHSEPGILDQHQEISKIKLAPIKLNKERMATSATTSSMSRSPQNEGVNGILSNPMSPVEVTTSYGVGLIDGTIPLIQYTRYASEFEEIGALGKGGFGSVFQCRNALDKREYAIKKVSIRKDSKLPQSDFTKRLKRTLREVKSLALLDHSNIVRYYTAWLELEQMNGKNSNNNKMQEVLSGSNYYWMSSTRTSQIKRSGFQLDHSRSTKLPLCKSKTNSANCVGFGKGLPSASDYSFSSSSYGDFDSTYNHFIPGIPEALDDYGFVFDRSGTEGETSCTAGEQASVTDSKTNLEKYILTDQQSVSKSDGKPCDNIARMKNSISFQSLTSLKSSIEESAFGLSRNQLDAALEKDISRREKEELIEAKPPISQRFILYIQMQFCSQKTLADFLSNEDARKGPSGTSIGDVDIPYALSLFLQTCQGVNHVHSQGLIHRDLKPNNIFIDDTGAVKVGDFGLSRESSDSSGNGIEKELSVVAESTNLCCNADITAGVGTRSYASPEQMKGGTDYDSSTDIYSLGIILFELCYPMYTGMERNIVLSKLRNHVVPAQWNETVAVDFPKLHSLLLTMISNIPGDRPSAHAVVQIIQSILEGFTISSLDKRDYEGSILLRVEIMFRENGLHQIMNLLRQTALPNLIDIVQYGLRSSSVNGEMKSIMEFAIVPRSEQPEDAPEYSPARVGELLVNTLSENPEVLLIRQVSATKYT